MAKPRWAPERGDVIYINHSPSGGREMPGQHPMLVLSTKMFNVKTQLVIGLPMTYAASNESNPFAVKLVSGNGEVSYVLGPPAEVVRLEDQGCEAAPQSQGAPGGFSNCLRSAEHDHFCWVKVVVPHDI